MTAIRITIMITFTDHLLHSRIFTPTITVAPQDSGGEENMLLRPLPSTVNVTMKKGEHKAGKCSSEKGIHLPKVTQLGSGRVGMEAVWLHTALLTTHASSLPTSLAWGPATAGTGH